MDKTNAERQARWRARRAAKIAELEAQVARQTASDDGPAMTAAAARIAKLEARVAELETERTKLANEVFTLRSTHPFTRAQFKLLMMQCHPDRAGTNAVLAKKLNSLFRTLRVAESRIVKSEREERSDEFCRKTNFPETPDDLLRRGAMAETQRSARAKAAGAKRKAKAEQQQTETGP